MFQQPVLSLVLTTQKYCYLIPMLVSYHKSCWLRQSFLQNKSLRFGLRKTKWNCYNNCLSFPWMQYHRRCCWIQKLFEYFNNKGKLKLDTCDSRVFILDWTCATDQIGKGKKAGAFTQLPFTTIWSINQETTRLEEWGSERRQARRGSHEVDG